MPGGKLRRDRITVWEFPIWIVVAIFASFYALIPFTVRIVLLLRERRKGVQ